MRPRSNLPACDTMKPLPAPKRAFPLPANPFAPPLSPPLSLAPTDAARAAGGFGAVPIPVRQCTRPALIHLQPQSAFRKARFLTPNGVQGITVKMSPSRDHTRRQRACLLGVPLEEGLDEDAVGLQCRIHLRHDQFMRRVPSADQRQFYNQVEETRAM